ncbi:MAG: hypothetical protein HQM14_13230 [SAR324 cluster bacterium]|nr:hypothetical protein [SAR324 cluster bacterium]
MCKIYEKLCVVIVSIFLLSSITGLQNASSQENRFVARKSFKVAMLIPRKIDVDKKTN